MRFLKIAIKDLKLLRRDRTALVFTFGMPIILTFIFGSVYGGSGDGKGGGLKILVSNVDAGERGAQEIQAMQDAGLRPIPELGGEAEIERKVANGAYALGMVIPQDFTQRFDAALGSPSSAQPVLRIIADPADTRVSSLIKGMISGANERLTVREVIKRFPDAGLALMNRPKVELNVLNAKSNSLTPGDIFLPGFMVYFVFTLANGVASTLLGERQEGTLRRMMNAPISRFEILAGKLTARAILGLFQTGMLVAIGVQWLHLTVAQAPVGILVTALATIFSACGLGLLMATFGRTMDQIQGMTTLFLLMLGFVSGTLIPRAFLPAWMVKVSYVTPHAWALNAYQDLIQRHHTLLSTLPNLGVVLLFGIGFFAIALARFKFE